MNFSASVLALLKLTLSCIWTIALSRTLGVILILSCTNLLKEVRSYATLTSTDILLYAKGRKFKNCISYKSNEFQILEECLVRFKYLKPILIINVSGVQFLQDFTETHFNWSLELCYLSIQLNILRIYKVLHSTYTYFEILNHLIVVSLLAVCNDCRSRSI